MKQSGLIQGRFLVVTTGGGGDCYWHRLGTVQGCCQTSNNVQDILTTKNRPAPEVNSSEVEKPCSEGRKAKFWKEWMCPQEFPGTGDKESLQTSGPAIWSWECRLLENFPSTWPQHQVCLTSDFHPNLFSTQMDQFSPSEHLSCPLEPILILW